MVIEGTRYKILEVERAAAPVPAGTVDAIDGAPIAGFDGGSFELTLLQPEGKAPQPGFAWLNGRRGEGAFIEEA